jgi:hypothetical protein
MSDPATVNRPIGYAYPSRVTVVRPKCGQTSAFPLASSHDNVVRYVGVCNAVYAAGLWCDASLNIEVSSHLLPT